MGNLIGGLKATGADDSEQLHEKIAERRGHIWAGLGKSVAWLGLLGGLGTLAVREMVRDQVASATTPAAEVAGTGPSQNPLIELGRQASEEAELKRELATLGYSNEVINEKFKYVGDVGDTNIAVEAARRNLYTASTYVNTAKLLQKYGEKEGDNGVIAKLEELLKNHGVLVTTRMGKKMMKFTENSKTLKQPGDFLIATTLAPHRSVATGWFREHHLAFFDEENKTLHLPDVQFKTTTLGAKTDKELNPVTRVYGTLMALNDARNWAKNGKVDYADETVFSFPMVLGDKRDLSVLKAQFQKIVDIFAPLLKEGMSEEELVAAAIKIMYIRDDLEEAEASVIEEATYQFFRELLVFKDPRVEVVKNQLLKLVKDPTKIAVKPFEYLPNDIAGDTGVILQQLSNGNPLFEPYLEQLRIKMRTKVTEEPGEGPKAEWMQRNNVPYFDKKAGVIRRQRIAASDYLIETNLTWIAIADSMSPDIEKGELEKMFGTLARINIYIVEVFLKGLEIIKLENKPMPILKSLATILNLAQKEAMLQKNGEAVDPFPTAESKNRIAYLTVRILLQSDNPLLEPYKQALKEIAERPEMINLASPVEGVVTSGVK